MGSNTHDDDIDMTLRLSSEDVPFEPIVKTAALTALHLHRPGEPMALQGPLSKRIAQKHYACVAAAGCCDDAGVAAWLAGVVSLLDGQPNLVDLIQAGKVEATIWITTLGCDPALPPVRLDPALVRAAVATGAEILLEDYNREDADGLVPAKTWFR